MKGFFSVFEESARSIKDLRTLCTAGMLLAMAIAVKSLGVDVTPDLRIAFSFIPIAVIGMLYGPVVCGISSFLLDFLGYIVANRSARAYSPQLAMVVLLSGIIYGLFLYKLEFSGRKTVIFSYLRIAAAFATVALVCNICLNTYLLYTLYVNPEFSLFDAGSRAGFLAYASPRVLKNLIEFPIRSVILMLLLPAVKKAYDRSALMFGKKAHE